MFRKDGFGTEDKPVGWDQIDRIRIAAWKETPTDDQPLRGAALLLRQLSATFSSTAIIVPDRKDGEARVAHQTADRIRSLLGSSGLTCDVLTEASLAHGSLGDRPLAILPHNPRLPDPAYQALATWVRKGGKLFTCYNSSNRILDLLGMKNPQYFKPSKPGGLAAIRFDTNDMPGMPETVRQASWNITTAEPATPSARIIGQWLDDSGRPTGHAALLISEHGAFFSHVVLSDDPEGKQAMLLSVLGKLYPPLWSLVATGAIDQAERIGNCRDGRQLASQLRDELTPTTTAQLAEADAALRRARALVADGKGFDAVQAAKSCRELRVAVYLRAQPSPKIEGRAWWNHSGTGAYPGDWDRTAKELADAGFNMVVPNMLWGGVAHYASDVLPRSQTFEKYGDQIAQCLAAAKKYGLEVHVWKVNHNLGRAPKALVDKLRRDGRLQVSYDGTPMNWLNPAHPENFKLELDSMLEVVRKYDVDGIHFDYIRYPNSKCDFSDYSRRKFEQDRGIKVKNWPADCYSGSLKDAYTDWRCEQITRLVAAVHDEAKKIRPNIKISAAVFSVYPGCREWVAQDWPLWIRKGYLDFVCPMDYTQDTDHFEHLIEAQQTLVKGRIPIYPGIGATASRSSLSPDHVIGQIHVTRQLRTGGYTIFNLSEATARRILPAARVGVGRNKATPPHRSSH